MESSSSEYKEIIPSEKCKSCQFIEAKIIHRCLYLSCLEKKY